MKCARRCPFISILGWMLLVAVTVSAAAADDNQVVLDRLQGMWRTQANEIQSARIDALYLNYACNRNEATITVARTDAFLEQLAAIAGGEVSVDELVRLASDLGIPERYKWCRLKIVADGENVNNIRTVFASDASDGELLMQGALKDGVGTTRFTHMKQASISKGPSQALVYPSSIRSDPWSPLPLQIDSVADGVVQLKSTPQPDGEQWSYTIFADTGLVKSSRRTLPANERFWEVRQLLPEEFTGGILFPRVSARFDGYGDKVTRLEVFLVRSAEFNVPIAAAEFDVPIPAGTVVADHRQGETATTLRTRVEAPDAVQAADNPTQYNKQPNEPAPPVGRNWTWIVLLNAIALAGILLAFWLRNRHRSSAK